MDHSLAALERSDHCFEVGQVDLMSYLMAQQRGDCSNIKAVHRLDVVVQTRSQDCSDATRCTGDRPHWLHRHHPLCGWSPSSETVAASASDYSASIGSPGYSDLPTDAPS